MTQELVSQILDLCKEIVAIKLIIHEARGGRLQKRCVDLALRLKTKQSPSEDGLILLKTCFEDIYDYLKRFRVKTRDLAIKIVKDGSGEVHFVKLNEQILNCCTILDIKMESNEAQDLQDLNEDCVVLRANLNSILEVFVTGPDSANRKTVILPAFDQEILQMVESQKQERNSYKSKRAPEESLNILPQNLVFLKPIGRGGFSTIWLGKYKGDQVAIKLFNIESSTATLKEFQHEAEIMRRLSHRNITAYYGVAETEKGFTMVMEYMENDSLFSYLKNNQSTPFEASKKVDIALDIARGIDFLHRLRIIHRDLKMGNVLLDAQFNAKIADFGLSVIKENQSSMIPLVEAGTSSYMAPETFGAGAFYSSKSDVFAYGILLWGLIHWSQPFGGVQREEIRQLVWKERYRLPISSGVPKPISSVISCCWSQSPAHRPTMSEVKDFLEKVVMIEGLINQNDVFSHEMTTQATALDPTIKTPQMLPASLPKPGITGSNSALSVKEESHSKSMATGIKPVHSAYQASAVSTKDEYPDRSSPSGVHPQQSIEKSPSVINLKPEAQYPARRRAPTAPLQMQDHALHKQGSTELARNLTTSAHRKAPSVPESYSKSPIPQSYAKPPTSALIQQPIEQVFQSKNKTHKHESVPQKSWFTKKTRWYVGICALVILLLAVLVTTLVVVLGKQQEKSTSGLSSTPTPSPTCKVYPPPTLKSYCKTSNPVVTTFVGNGQMGNKEGPISTAQVQYPTGIGFHPDGSLYIADQLGMNKITNNVLINLPIFNNTNSLKQFDIDEDGIMYMPLASRYVASADTSTYETKVFAGNVSGQGSEDNVDLSLTQFSNPIQVLIYRGLLYIASRGNQGAGWPGTVRVIDPCPYTKTPGSNTTVIMNGPFNRPNGVAVDPNGDIYYSNDNYCINKYIVQNQTTVNCFAGTRGISNNNDGPPGTGAFNRTGPIIFDDCGNMFVGDQASIRMVDQNGTITTVTKNVFYPQDLAFSPTGDLYVTEYYHRVTKITFS